MIESVNQTSPAIGSDDSSDGANVLAWPAWQRSVLCVLRTELRDLVQHLGVGDVDWPAWQVYYKQGRSPRSAVYRALERDL
jgi:hypothetical protein